MKCYKNNKKMDKQLIKTFSKIKSSCKTRNQRLAFNALVKSFASNIDKYTTLEWWINSTKELYEDDPETNLVDPKTADKVAGLIVKALKANSTKEVILVGAYNDEHTLMDEDYYGEIPSYKVYDGNGKEDVLFESKKSELRITYQDSPIPSVCWQPDIHSNGAEVYFINKKNFMDAQKCPRNY